MSEDHDVLQRAHAAKNELPQTKRAVDLLKQATMEDWSNCQDPAERERLWQRINVLQDIHQMLVVASTEVDLAAYRATLNAAGFQS